MTEKPEDYTNYQTTPDPQHKIFRVKISEEFESGVGNVDGETCMVLRNKDSGVTMVISLEDVEKMAQIYAEHCLPEDDVYQ